MSHKKIWIETWAGHWTTQAPTVKTINPELAWFRVVRTTRAGKEHYLDSFHTLEGAIKHAVKLQERTPDSHFSLDWYEELRVLFLLRVPLTHDHFYAGRNRELKRVIQEEDFDERDF